MEKDPYVYWNGLDPHHEVYISWETENPSPYILKYGESPENLNMSLSLSSSVFYKVHLSNLNPGKIHYYQLIKLNEEGEILTQSSVRSFRTSPYENVPFNITIISDTQQFLGTGHWNTIAKAIGRHGDTAFLAIAGDVAQREDDQENWNVFWKYASYVTASIPLVTTPGNHDNPDNPQSLYLKYFGNTTRDYGCQYAFNWSNTQFVFMHIAITGIKILMKLRIILRLMHG